MVCCCDLWSGPMTLTRVQGALDDTAFSGDRTRRPLKGFLVYSASVDLYLGLDKSVSGAPPVC